MSFAVHSDLLSLRIKELGILKVKREVLFGIFTIGALLVFWVGVNYLKGSRLLGKPFTLYAEYENVQGLVRGNPITINGLRVGKVGDLQLDLSAGIAKATLQFDEPLKIPINSVAMIYSSDLLGSKAINISVNEELTSPNFFNDGEYIEGIQEENILSKAEDLVPEGTKILIELSRLASDLNQITTAIRQLINDEQGKDAIRGTLEEVRYSAENVRSITEQVDSITTVFEKISQESLSIVSAVEDRNDDVQGIINNVRITTDSLKAASGDIKSLMADASSTVGSVENIFGKLDTTTGTLGLLLNDRQLYDSIISTTDNLNALVKEVNKNPRRFFDDLKIYLIERKKKNKED